MPMYLDCLGASNEVGRSAFMLHTDRKIMLDYGVKIFDESGKPAFPIEHEDPDFALITHAHLDHSGFVPALYRHSRIRWYATPPTRDICEVLWQDSMKIMGPELPYKLPHFKKAMKYWTPILYGQALHIGGTKVRMFDAGHICGAGMAVLEYEGRSVCYTGDFKMDGTYMHRGARPVEDVDVLITESTYANREHPPRRDLEQQFIDEILETIGGGGNVLLPAFALGRTQELLATVRSHIRDVPVFVDGMGRELTRIYLRYPKYLRDAERLRKAVRSVSLIQGPWERRDATAQPSIIITSAGMMNGGPVLDYLQRLRAGSKIIFTGYSVEGTNAWKLLHDGYVTINEQDMDVEMPVEYLDFSAHAGRKDLLNFIKHANPEKIVLVHGDDTKVFEEELRDDFGYDAVAPKLGERLEL